MAGKCGMPAISGQAFCVSLGEQCVHGVPALGGKAKQRRHPVSRVSNVPFDEAAEVIVREEHDANVLLHDEAGCACVGEIFVEAEAEGRKEGSRLRQIPDRKVHEHHAHVQLSDLGPPYGSISGF